MKTNSIFKPYNNYCLYLENLLSGAIGHRRYFRTIKDALNYIEKVVIFSSSSWRLVRTTDGKNFTNRIYNY